MPKPTPADRVALSASRSPHGLLQEQSSRSWEPFAPVAATVWVWRHTGRRVLPRRRLLGVLVGRWLRFRGASTVALVAVVGVCLTSQIPGQLTSEAAGFRNWVPWSMWHWGTNSDGLPFEGVPAWSQALLAGNPATYLLYLIALCALACGGAIWHDRTARTPRLRLINVGLVVAAVALFLVTALTGVDGMIVSGSLQ